VRQHSNMHKFSKTLIAGLITGGALLAQPALAQLSSATIRGQITQGGAVAKAPVQIIATNKATGATYRANAQSDGSYVLVGLAPGSYALSVAGSKEKAQEVTVQVGETASVDLALSGAPGAVALDAVVVVGSLQRKNVKSSEVGTSVSRQQIENLPQVTRNFLSFADLAPGVRFSTDPSTGYVKIQGGAQNQDNVNVFIDGVSQKNDILRGGISGLDSSRGNPFPQSAIAEYKVISQNYKAEFDQVSSTAITAVTKSGGNELHGDVFWDHTGSNLVAYSPFEQINQANGNDRSSYGQDQYGFSLGGPIKEDVAHFFFSYEGKNIGQPRNVGLASVAQLLPNAGLVPSFLGMQGSHNQTFKENLLFAKLDLQLSRDSRLEISGRMRRESDLVAENTGLSAPGNDKNRANDETRFDVKHEWTSDTMLNEARFGYEDYTWNPHSASNSPEIKYFISPTNTNGPDKREFLWAGGSPDAQLREQKGLLFQDDLTYTGKAGHTFKTGVKFKQAEFNLSGSARSVDILQELIGNTTGQPITGLYSGDPTAPYFAIDAALPAVPVNYKDNQFGIYLQDDWSVTKKLEVNLGVRWDYESNMLNNDYVTPADRVAAINAVDTRNPGDWGLAPPPAGQTYAQSLAKGGININDYISTGTSRKTFNGAIAPRVGFSFDVMGDKQTVVFAGLGRSYDRTMANHAIDELQKNAVPNGEIWLIRNDFKMPFSDQFSIGLRQAVQLWNTEVGYTYSHAQNQFNWFGGNRDTNGGWGKQSPIDPLWGGPAGFGTLILGDFISEAKTESVYLKADKPYTRLSGWGFGVTYTYSDGQTTNKEWTNDIFNWTYGKSSAGWNPSTDVERHRLVASGVTDGLLPWGLMLSSKVTVGSGLPYRITSCAAGWDQCVSVKGDGGPFRQVDLGVSKDLGVGPGKLAFRLDVINLFNTVNYGGYDSWGGGPGNPQNSVGGDNAHMGVPGGISGPMRTLKLGMRYVF
jgi:outer membrane receptor protein involved in Fe transport